MKVLTVSLALLLSVAAPTVLAGGHGKGKMNCPMHDAAATPGERARHHDEMFAKLDADGNGAIDRAEFAKHHEDMRRAHAEHAAHDAGTPEAKAEAHDHQH